MTEYNKLVRDKIPDIIRQKGQVPVTHVVDNAEYQQRLIDKLEEEVAEFKANPSKEELADIQEVVNALAKALGLTKAELEAYRKQKAKASGSFSKRIILERVIDKQV